MINPNYAYVSRKITLIFNYVFFVTIVMSVLLSYKIYRKARALHEISIAKLSQISPAQMISVYRNNECYLGSNGRFLFEYGQLLASIAKYDLALPLFKESRCYSISEELYESTIQCHVALRQFHSAEVLIKELISMVPNRFFPRFELVDVYLKQGDTIQATQEAKRILAMPVKIPSQEISNIKTSLLEVIKR
jgi:tetratricopeptide (TPR) repeat protein